MKNLALRLSVLLSCTCLIVLFSLSAFSFSSKANTIGNFYSNQGTLPIALDGFTVTSFGTSQNLTSYLACFKDSYGYVRVALCVNNPNTWRQSAYINFIQNGISSSRTWNSLASYDTVDGIDFYYLSWFDSGTTLGMYTYPNLQSLARAIRSQDALNIPHKPDADIFELSDFNYVTYYNSNTFIPNQIYQLSYYITWTGSSSIDYPISSVSYQLRGFYDDSDITKRDNGILVDSGTCSSPFDYDVYSHIKNWNNQTDYKNFVLYLTPFSDNTEGVTKYILCNVITSDVELDLFGFNIPVGDLFGINSAYSDGSIIPLTSPNNISSISGSGHYVTTSRYGTTNISGISNNTSGSIHYGDIEYVTHTENTYSPIVTIDNSESISNIYNDNSQIINNNNSYNSIINYIYNSADVTLDDDNSGYVNSIIAFLTTIVTFFSTMWSYCLVAFEFLPTWTIVLCTSLFSLSGTVVIGLGILKLLKV